MEFLNQIKLRGVVGRTEITTFPSGQVCNFSVVTDYSTMDRDRNPVIETTWLNVSAWGGREGVPDLYSIQKGNWVQVTGRLRMRRYTSQENGERTLYDVLARKVEILPREDTLMQPQRDW